MGVTGVSPEVGAVDMLVGVGALRACQGEGIGGVAWGKAQVGAGQRPEALYWPGAAILLPGLGLHFPSPQDQSPMGLGGATPHPRHRPCGPAACR